jgi:hypothetical protein
MKWRPAAAAWFSIFLEKAFVNLANLRHAQARLPKTPSWLLGKQLRVARRRTLRCCRDHACHCRNRLESSEKTGLKPSGHPSTRVQKLQRPAFCYRIRSHRILMHSFRHAPARLREYSSRMTSLRRNSAHCSFTWSPSFSNRRCHGVSTI